MSYRVRFTLPHGSTGHWAREYATREEAQRAIDDRQKETGLDYAVEEVGATAAVPDARPEPATPEARIRDLEAELAQLRDAYDAAVRDYDAARRNVAGYKAALAASHQGPAKASEAPGEGQDSGEDPIVDDIIREMVLKAKASEPTTERLVAMLRARHARGLAKYGVTVDRADLTPEEWAQHAIEEMLDGAAYLMRLRDTMAEARAKEAKP